MSFADASFRSGGLFDAGAKAAEQQDIETKMSAPDFWDSREAAGRLVTRLKQLRAVLDPLAELEQEVEDIGVLGELALEEDDAATMAEAAQALAAAENRLARFEFRAMLSHENDPRDAFVSIHAGVFSGALAACAVAISPWWWLGLTAAPLVVWARTRRGRHTVLQGLVGSCLAVAVTATTYLAVVGP